MNDVGTIKTKSSVEALKTVETKSCKSCGDSYEVGRFAYKALYKGGAVPLYSTLSSIIKIIHAVLYSGFYTGSALTIHTLKQKGLIPFICSKPDISKELIAKIDACWKEFTKGKIYLQSAACEIVPFLNIPLSYYYDRNAELQATDKKGNKFTYDKEKAKKWLDANGTEGKEADFVTYKISYPAPKVEDKKSKKEDPKPNVNDKPSDDGDGSKTITDVKKSQETEQQQQELEAQKQKELEAQQQQELEAQKQKELEAQQQQELEAQKQKELEAKQQQELEAQKQKELEAQQQQELEAQKQKELEAKQQQELEAQKQKELEAQKLEEQPQAKGFGPKEPVLDGVEKK